jgi:nitric oxide reductase NorD protein
MTADTSERQKLDCNFARAQSVFGECFAHAQRLLTPVGADAYVDGANSICKMGRGEEPVLAFLEEMPLVAKQLGCEVIADVVEFTKKLARTPNSRAIAPFLQSLAAAARHLESRELFGEYLQLVWQIMQRTSPKVHGIDAMYASECLPEFLNSAPFLLGQISLGGLKNWADYGVKGYPNDPARQRDYFMLQSADSRAIMQRERRGTLLTDHERRLDLYLRGLWQGEAIFRPYSLAFDQLRKPVPYLDDNGIHLPDVYEDTSGIRGIDRYRALLAHLSAHRRWTEPLMADNFSPFQRIAIEAFEDSRVEWLALQEYPGLRKLWCALHPAPKEIEHQAGVSYIRHRLAMLSRALLDPEHGYRNPDILRYAEKFHALMAAGNTATRDMVDLGVHFISQTRKPSDSSPRVYFDDTEIGYRDDNRLMWRFFEDGDEEMYETRPRKVEEDEGDAEKMPPRLYPEWDYAAQRYNPDWVSLYEHLHPGGDAAFIDRLLAKHGALAKKLKKIIDLLKPQQKVRVRYQEDGQELDLDVAIRALTDFKGGAQPDPRINMSHKNDGRSIAVSLLLDLSASLADVPEGSTQSKLELSQEAVSLLAWAVSQLGDAFAIGGFHSDTRHEVRYLHIKGYKEDWNDAVKARLAAIEAGFSTRMGAALRHAGHYLDHQQADKKLLLVLTDGEPADIDCKDPRLLIEDARIAVRELDQKGIYTYCINLDAKADEYVREVYGKRYAVIDNIERLPERLPQLFMSLTQ